MLPVIPADKANHAVYGAAIFAATYALAAFQQLPALHIAAAAVVLAAFGKEVYDYRNRDKHTPDFMDAVATIVGGVVVAVPLVIPKVLETIFTLVNSFFILFPIIK